MSTRALRSPAVAGFYQVPLLRWWKGKKDLAAQEFCTELPDDVRQHMREIAGLC